MSSLTLTLIQTQLFWEDKQANMSMLEEKINHITEKTEIVVLPEMFTTGFSMNTKALAETMDGRAVQWMRKIAARKKIILTGSMIVEDEGRYFNRLIWMLPNGEHGYYDKHHLFAYGSEDLHFSAGNKRLIASVKGWKINLLVCYDLRFPVWARQQPLTVGTGLEYDLLIYVANWPERRIQAWKTLLQARAIENQSYVVGVNRVGTDANDIYYSGESMVIDPVGEILYQKSHDEDLFTITLQKDPLTEIRHRFPFWKDADPFVIIKSGENTNEQNDI